MMLDVTDRLVVIIGGGAVAVRKAQGVLECGATRVRVVAPNARADMPSQVERVDAVYEARHLDGAGLVFAATDSPVVNEQVVRDARERGVLVNRADDADGGDFVTPARFQEGEVVLTVSAGSAALAVAIRDDLAPHLDRRHVNMAHAMQTLRPLVRDRAPADRRGAILRDLASDEAIAALDQAGERGLRDWIARKYPELKL
jgi:siroheme synthase-like protein